MAIFPRKPGTTPAEDLVARRRGRANDRIRQLSQGAERGREVGRRESEREAEKRKR